MSNFPQNIVRALTLTVLNWISSIYIHYSNYIDDILYENLESGQRRGTLSSQSSVSPSSPEVPIMSTMLEKVTEPRPILTLSCELFVGGEKKTRIFRTWSDLLALPSDWEALRLNLEQANFFSFPSFKLILSSLPFSVSEMKVKYKIRGNKENDSSQIHKVWSNSMPYSMAELTRTKLIKINPLQNILQLSNSLQIIY